MTSQIYIHCISIFQILFRPNISSSFTTPVGYPDSESGFIMESSLLADNGSTTTFNWNGSYRFQNNPQNGYTHLINEFYKMKLI